jgi:hypothetical protein
MDTFCTIAFLPSIILAIALLFQVRKYVITSKRLKHVETRWRMIKDDDSEWGYNQEDEYIESIPPPPPTNRRPTRPSRRTRNRYANDYDRYDYENENYDFNYLSSGNTEATRERHLDPYYDNYQPNYEDDDSRPQRRTKGSESRDPSRDHPSRDPSRRPSRKRRDSQKPKRSGSTRQWNPEKEEWKTPKNAQKKRRKKPPAKKGQKPIGRESTNVDINWD